MATRFAKFAAASIETFRLAITKRSGVQILAITPAQRLASNNSTSRWASSYSSSPPSDSPPPGKMKKKKNKSNLIDRLSTVIDAVNDRKLPPELRGQRNSVRSGTDIINVAEQRIWRSMEEGHFENLPGKGKPLEISINPHADPADDTYRILSKNGRALEWVELDKQIRTDAAEWRSALKKAWVDKANGNTAKWTECSEALKRQITAINNKVFRYNLVVPFGRQMIGMKWEKELDQLKDL